MKRIAKSITASSSIESVKWKATQAKAALSDFVRVAKQYDDINDYITPSEFTSIDKVLTALDDVVMGVYVQYDEDEI